MKSLSNRLARVAAMLGVGLAVALTGLAGTDIAVSTAHAAPVRAIAGLTSISFWERTGGAGPTEFEFLVNGPELTTRLFDPLGAANNDIAGAGTEFYDVYYSNIDGAFNLDGEYLTISGVFLFGLPAGGGLNLAEIGLNFASDPVEFGNFVASFVALGDNAFPGEVNNAIDGDLLTHTTMGNTIGQSDRLRLTLGFESSSGPPVSPIPLPAAFPLFAGGLGLLALFGWRRKRMAAA